MLVCTLACVGECIGVLVVVVWLVDGIVCIVCVFVEGVCLCLWWRVVGVVCVCLGGGVVLMIVCVCRVCVCVCVLFASTSPACWSSLCLSVCRLPFSYCARWLLCLVSFPSSIFSLESSLFSFVFFTFPPFSSLIR